MGGCQEEPSGVMFIRQHDRKTGQRKGKVGTGRWSTLELFPAACHSFFRAGMDEASPDGGEG